MDKLRRKIPFFEKIRSDKRVSGFLTNVKEKLVSFISNYITVEQGETPRESISARLNFAAKGLGLAFMAFFFGRADTVFSVYPLGTALLAACGKYTPFVYIGLIISTLFSVGEAIPMFLMYTMGILLRFIISYGLVEKKRSPLFGEGMMYRTLVSIAMMFMIGIYRCVSGGFLWYDFFGLVFGVIVSPLITLLYCGIFIKRHRFTSYHDLGMAAIMASCVFSLNDFTLLGFSLSAVAAFAISLYISKECGMLRGGVAGLIAGLAYNVIYSPLFALTGLISGLFWKIGSAAATGAALAAGVVYGIYLDGFSTLSMLAPDLLAGSLIFVPLSTLGLLPKPILYSGGGSIPDNYADKIAVAGKKEESGTMRFKAMSEALTSLSRTFYNLSNAQKRPELSAVRQRCRSCFETECTKCPRRSICWDEGYEDTAEAVNNIATLIYNGNVITEADVPDFMRRRCNRMESIIKSINENYSRQLEEAIRSNKAEIFAIDYAAMSALLDDAIKENAKEYEIDEKLTAHLKNAARYLNFSSSNLAVYGNRRKQIIAGGVDLARVKLGVDEIRRSFERVCHIPLCSPEFSVEKGYISMTMRSARIFKTEYAYATVKKEKEEINGDTLTFFENSEDYFYSLLGDGMGSGKDAALASRLAGVYLDKMLRAGNKKEQAVEMLNAFLREKNCESFTTIDLLEIDLITGEASFVKSGAAPSYILRESSLFKISSNTMPIGITKELNAEEVKFILEPEDVIVMVSDGISESFEDGIWLTDMLLNDWKKGMSLEDMCERVIAEAKERNSERDDMTIGMVKVLKNR